jgi:transposase
MPLREKERNTQANDNFNKPKIIPLTKEAKFFLEACSPKQRQYEALRAYFVGNLTSKEVAKRFGYTVNAFRILCYQFKHDKKRQFFIESKPGPKYSPKRDLSRERVLALRKKNYSVQDIQRLLQEEKISISAGSIWSILQEEGFSRLPRRKDEERPDWPRPDKASYADIRKLSWDERTIETRFGGLFLLMKILAELEIDEIPKELKWYGSKMIPIGNGFLSCLLLKLINKERKSHVMDIVFDEGVALSVGLNEVPKTAYICEYSERVTHRDALNFMNSWIKRLQKLNVIVGESFNLDFQSLPYYGEESVVEKHYVSMRSRRQKAILVFFAQDVDSKIFCYSNADLRKGEESDEIFRFIEFWKQQSGKNPPHLVFDSKVTTYENLSRLNKMNIAFVTLRRRTPSILKEVTNIPTSAWRTITLSNVERKYKTPKVIDRKITLSNYDGEIRQIFVKDLGHDLPTIIITNDFKTSCNDIITRYALRMLIENAISACVNFFHTTALSSSVAIRIDLDVLLTLVGQATYHILATKLRGYENSTPDVIFRKFIDTPAKIYIRDQEIEVCLNKRSNNPILLHSGMLNQTFKLPWVQDKIFRITLR